MAERGGDLKQLKEFIFPLSQNSKDEILNIVGYLPDYELFPHMGSEKKMCLHCSSSYYERKIIIYSLDQSDTISGTQIHYCVFCPSCTKTFSLIREWYPVQNERSKTMGSPSRIPNGPSKYEMNKKVEPGSDTCPRCNKKTLKTVQYSYKGSHHHSEYECMSCDYCREA